jgi:hypothetical protein
MGMLQSVAASDPPLVVRTCTCEITGLSRHGILLVGLGYGRGNCSVNARSATMDCAPLLSGYIAGKDTGWTYGHIWKILHVGLSETSVDQAIPKLMKSAVKLAT